MDKAYIYWIHLPEHTSMKSEGYIGVANNHNRRFKEHKKGKGNNPHLEAAFQKYSSQIVKHVIWLGKEADCYKNEEILRPEPNIGWNICKGGGKPPSAMKGNQHHNKKPEMREKFRIATIKQWKRQHQTRIYKKDIPRIPSEKNKLKGDQRTLQQKEASQKHSERMKGRTPWNKRG